MSDRDLYFGDFERDGEEVVRNHLAAQRYGESKKRLAEEWLRRREQDKFEASREAEMDLARRATEAAESAASSARTANQIAKDARNISYFAAVVALAAFVIGVVGVVIP